MSPLARIRSRLRFGAFVQDRKGAVAIEFAFVSPLLFAIVIACIQISQLFMASTDLERMKQEGVRLNQIGATAGFTVDKFRSAVCSSSTFLIDCSQVMFSLQPQSSCGTVSTALAQLTYDANGNVTNQFPFNTGAPENIMVLQLMYQMPMIGGPLFGLSTQPNGSRLLVATSVFANEP